MSTTSRRMLRQEAELMNRFADAYRGKFAIIIDQLNRAPGALSEHQCMRLCVETLSMLLATQTHLADALSRLGCDETVAAE